MTRSDLEIDTHFLKELIHLAVSLNPKLFTMDLEKHSDSIAHGLEGLTAAGVVYLSSLLLENVSHCFIGVIYRPNENLSKKVWDTFEGTDLRLLEVIPIS